MTDFDATAYLPDDLLERIRERAPQHDRDNTFPETDLEELRHQLTGEQFVPMYSLAVRADVFTAMHVAQQFFLYLPLGSLLAVWPLRQRGFWSGLRPALLLAIVMGNDTAAYFTGKRFGKAKLAPQISPNKTIAGVYGALGCGLVEDRLKFRDKAFKCFFRRSFGERLFNFLHF